MLSTRQPSKKRLLSGWLKEFRDARSPLLIAKARRCARRGGLNSVRPPKCAAQRVWKGCLFNNLRLQNY